MSTSHLNPDTHDNYTLQYRWCQQIRSLNVLSDQKRFYDLQYKKGILILKQHSNKNEVKYNPFEDATVYKQTFDDKFLYPFKEPKSLNEAALIMKGSAGRLTKLMKKAAAGEDINLAVLGGSITEGSGRSDGNYYGDLLNRWFQSKYPNCKITYTNVGRGTTTSLFGCARVERDVAPLNCDMIVVEYSVNDLILEPHIAREAFEALLRKLLMLPSLPYIFVLFSCMGSLGNTQELDIPICKYYDIPCASLADALKWHLKQEFGTDYENKMTENDISDYIVSNFIYDGCHPNTYGYSLLADFITFAIEYSEKELTLNETTNPLPEAPLYSLRFMDSHIENNESLTVLENSGWKKADKEEPYRERGFIAEEPGASITFAFECRMLTMVTRRSVNPKTGSVEVSIDNGDPFLLDGYFHNGWGTHNDYRVIIDSAEKKRHTVTVKFTGKPSKEGLEKAEADGLPHTIVGSRFIISEFLPS